MPHIFLTLTSHLEPRDRSSPLPGQVLQVQGVDRAPFQPLLVLHQVQNNGAPCRSALLGYYSLRRPGFYLPIKGSVYRAEDEMERGQLYLKAIKVLNCKVKKLKAKVLLPFYFIISKSRCFFLWPVGFDLRRNPVSQLTTLLYLHTPLCWYSD